MYYEPRDDKEYKRIKKNWDEMRASQYGTKKVTRGTSAAPIVLGVIGGVLSILASLASGLIGTIIGAMGSALTNGQVLTDAQIITGIKDIIFIVALCGIVSLITACFSKRTPMFSGILMIICSIIILLLCFITVNKIGLFSGLLILIGGILSITQEKETFYR